MSLRDLIISIVLLAGCYWAYINYFQGQKGNYQDMKFTENAREMRKCVEREDRLARISGNAGIIVDTSNIESMCANELGMYFDEGRWHKY